MNDKVLVVRSIRIQNIDYGSYGDDSVDKRVPLERGAHPTPPFELIG